MKKEDSGLEIFDLTTKNQIDCWYTFDEPANMSDEEKKELKRWLSDYPECSLETWNFRVLS